MRQAPEGSPRGESRHAPSISRGTQRWGRGKTHPDSSRQPARRRHHALEAAFLEPLAKAAVTDGDRMLNSFQSDSHVFEQSFSLWWRMSGSSKVVVRYLEAPLLFEVRYIISSGDALDPVLLKKRSDSAERSRSQKLRRIEKSKELRKKQFKVERIEQLGKTAITEYYNVFFENGLVAHKNGELIGTQLSFSLGIVEYTV
ncbi:hypothetical protein EJB05_01616, partial [Eragrostis curvula]